MLDDCTLQNMTAKQKEPARFSVNFCLPVKIRIFGERKTVIKLFPLRTVAVKKHKV